MIKEQVNLAIAAAKKYGITYEQRRKITEWAKAAGKIPGEVLENEKEAWLESLLNILNETKTKDNNEEK